MKKLIREASKGTDKRTLARHLPVKAVSSSQDPLGCDDRPSTQVTLTGQFHLQADLPGPLAPRRVRSSHDSCIYFCCAH